MPSLYLEIRFFLGHLSVCSANGTNRSSKASLTRLMDCGQEVETAAARCKAARPVENEVLHPIADSERLFCQLRPGKNQLQLEMSATLLGSFRKEQDEPRQLMGCTKTVPPANRSLGDKQRHWYRGRQIAGRL